MRVLQVGKNTARAGFTLVEVSVAMVIASVLTYAMVSTLQMGDNTISTVKEVRDCNAESREVMRRLIDEFQVTNDAMISVLTLPDFNHQVTFKMPIEVGGNLTWGVFDEALGPDTASQTKVDWTVRYTTVTLIEPGGGTNRQLVRQILDLTDTVQLQETVVEQVRSGNDIPPGFQMVKNGDMWEISLSTFGQEADDPANVLEFQIWARN